MPSGRRPSGRQRGRASELCVDGVQTLRRVSYDTDEKGLLLPGYVNVFGVPLFISETGEGGDPFRVKRPVSEGRMALPTPFETKRKKAPIGALGRIQYLKVAEDLGFEPVGRLC